jgi:hypothetical protein
VIRDFVPWWQDKKEVRYSTGAIKKIIKTGQERQNRYRPGD